MHLPIVLRLAGVALLAQAAAAQRLDLGSGPAEPKPGEGLATLALADLLEAEAGGLDEDDAQRSFRQLAATLLRAGENAGPDGSEAVLAALTLAANREQLDRLLRAHDQATHAYIAGVLDAARPTVLPRGVDLILRDALAPLETDTDQPCGWWLTSSDDDQLPQNIATLRTLIDNRRLTDDASAVLTEMVALLDSALGEPAYGRDAAAWGALLAAAAAALDEPPAWLDMPARDQLRADLSTGVVMCLDKPDEARAVLTRTATLRRIVRATEALADAHQSRELREAVNRLGAAAEGDAKRDPAVVARVGETYLRALDLIDADRRIPAQTDLVRQVRPMLKPLIESHRQATGAVVRVLPTILADPDPMTEPGVLAAMSSLAATAEDLRTPQRLSTLLAGWTGDVSRPTPAPGREPLATREAGPLAERVRALGVALGREKEAADALAELRTLADISEFVLDIPGEQELRAGAQSPTWRRITGDQADRLLFLVGQARDTWLRSASTEQSADRRPGDEARLRALAALLPLLRDGAAIEAMRFDWSRKNRPTINAWPGWELTAPGLDALAAGLTPRLAELGALAARADDDAGVLARAARLREDYAAALLCARLDASARNRAAAPCDIAAELGTGAPTQGAWMVSHRHALAAVCRSTYEAAAAGDESRAVFLAHANRLALPVLDALP